MIIAANGNVPTDIHIAVSSSIVVSWEVLVNIFQGHSLGASYATLCYAELLRLQSRPTTIKFVLQDLYTFGSPRIALDDFADAFYTALLSHKGHSWRICSARDPITLIPPALLTDPKFTHVDRSYLVAADMEPEESDTERGTHPRPPLPIVGMNMSHHSR